MFLQAYCKIVTPTGLQQVHNSPGNSAKTDLVVPLDAKTKELMAIWEQMDEAQRCLVLEYLRLQATEKRPVPKPHLETSKNRKRNRIESYWFQLVKHQDPIPSQVESVQLVFGFKNNYHMVLAFLDLLGSDR